MVAGNHSAHGPDVLRLEGQSLDKQLAGSVVHCLLLLLSVVYVALISMCFIGVVFTLHLVRRRRWNSDRMWNVSQRFRDTTIEI